MTSFDKLRCNGRENPACIDEAPVFSWNYQADHQRDVVQKFVTVEVFGETGQLLFSKRLRSSKMQYLWKARRTPLTVYRWRVTAELSNGQVLQSPMQSFGTGLLGRRMESYGAKWIAGRKKYEQCALSFRRQLVVEKPLHSASALLFSTAWQKVSVNGRELREDCRLLPANSSYSDRCLYEQYDLTEALHPGENALDVLTGAGYNSSYSCFGWRLECGKALLGLLVLRYQDGSVEYIGTDDRWDIYSSSITYCNIYNGEHYDATLTPRKLESARIRRSPVPKAKLEANEMPPIQVCRTVTPVRCTRKGSAWLYDMGENFAGVTKITLSAPKGTKITLQHSEMVYEDGSQRLTTNKEAQARDVYICAGDGPETYVPTFTYHGYRYVTVSGITPAVKMLEVTGLALSAEVSCASHFQCSDAVINRIHENAVRSLRSNLVSIPTDCPSRGERTPCAMDSLCTEVANLWNFDVQSYYRKWLGDINRGADTADDHGNPDWDGDKIILAYRLLSHCNDLETVRKYYPDMKRCLAMFEKGSPDGLWHEGFGDWCHLNEHTWETYHGSVTVVNTCLYYAICRQMALFARLLNQQADEAAFERLAQKVRGAFCETLLKPDGTVNTGAHTEQVMALYTRIVPEAQAPAVLAQLTRKLKTEPMDLGIFGIMALAEVLPRYRESQLLLELLHNPQYPGYLYQIANGATSLWEVWSFDGPMASHNHAMFAGIEDAFYGGLAGIRPLENGFAAFRVAPVMPEGMSYVNCTVETVSGQVRLSWVNHGAGLELSLSVPANTRAEVVLPTLTEPWALYDGEVRLSREQLPVEDGCVRLSVGSGRYCFRMVREALIAPNTPQTQHPQA